LACNTSLLLLIGIFKVYCCRIVINILKIDDKRGVDQRATEKVEDVESVLGREARRDYEE